MTAPASPQTEPIEAGPPKQSAPDARDRPLAGRDLPAALWQAAWSSRSRAVRTLLVLLSVLISALVGVLYANIPVISIYPILWWLAAVIVCVAALAIDKLPTLPRFNRTWLGLLGLLIFSLCVRAANLQNLPPGFHLDEMGRVNFALTYVFNPLRPQETINPFRTGGDSEATMYAYVLRSSMLAGGMTVPGARALSVVAGSLAVLAVFLMVNEMAGRTTAWLAAIFMSAFHYHVHWSRLALNNIWTTLLLPLTVGFFLFGWRKGWGGGALLAGLCLGLSAYFYAGGYVLLILMIPLLWRTWRQTKDRRGLVAYTARMLAMAWVVAGPLIIFAALYPNLFLDRSRIVAAWVPSAMIPVVGDAHAYGEYFWYQFSRSFGGYNFYADYSHFYAPGIPYLIGIASILFPVGIAQAVYQKQYFPVFWWVLVTFMGGFLVTSPPASSHLIAVIPAVCWLIAVPLAWLIERDRPLWAYLLLFLIVGTDLYFYFGVYAAHPSGDLNIPFPSVAPYGG